MFTRVNFSWAASQRKTTILRDLCRLISFGEGRIPTRTVLLDERNELGGWDGEKCAFQLGPCTDILSGLPKAEAIRRATRTLSPQVILCDEIADEHEATAIQYAFSAGSVLWSRYIAAKGRSHFITLCCVD